MRSSYLKHYLVFAVTFMLYSCSSQPPIPQSKYYHFPEPELKEVVRKNNIYDVIQVRRPVARGIYNERAILYVSESKPLALRRYHYHFWAQNPSSLIHRHIVRALQQAGASNKVITKSGRQDVDLIIGARILRFEQIESASHNKAYVSIEFTVQKDSVSNTFEFDAQVTASNKSMHALVESFGKAADIVMHNFISSKLMD